MNPQDIPSQMQQLPNSVIRIRGGDQNNPNQYHTGTGFFYNFKDRSKVNPFIVSNKHVLTGKTWLEFDFALRKSDNGRLYAPPKTVRVNAGDLPIYEHPDHHVDLAAIPIEDLLQNFDQNNIKIYLYIFSKDSMPPANVEKVLHAGANALMVGFPNGLMDEENNLPLMRRGILATPHYVDYLGKKNFVVDIATFAGSSGSPIFAFFENMFTEENGMNHLLDQPKAFLIGVLHSGPTISISGRIEPVPVPTQTFASETQTMLNLGYCLKAELIEELRPLIFQS